MNDLPEIKTRCRQIGASDLGAIADLLARGFPGRSRDYWARGLARQGERQPPPDCPRYGFMLEADGRVVGAILLIYQAMTEGGTAEGGTAEGGVVALRCNLSSWYVEPDFRIQAPLLIAMAMKRKDVTYVNISPAPHTWRTIEAQNFICYAQGQFFSVPALSQSAAKVRIAAVGAGPRLVRTAALPEADLLEDHAALGCLSLTVSWGEDAFPFVFLPFRMRAGRMPTPCLQLIYCREIADFVRFAGPIGRYLLRSATTFVMMDAKGPVPGLVGFYRDRMSPKYYRGPDRPRLGDLAYTERVVYGP